MKKISYNTNMRITSNIWFHVIFINILLLAFFAIFFGTYYGSGYQMASTATFITFALYFMISFIMYRTNYKAVPSRRTMRKYKNDMEQFHEDRSRGKKMAGLLILTYLPLLLTTLMISLLVTYIV